MSRFETKALALATALCIAGSSGCNREKREFPKTDSGQLSGSDNRMSPLQPVQNAMPAKQPVQKQVQQLAQQPLKQPANMPADYYKKYEENAYAASQGKRLFRWYNCNGCHAQGGGDIGPPLIDDKWLYGGEPAQIYATIVQGRPNGMPSFGGHISEDQLWQLVAYVRSMSGQLRTDVAPSRSDSLQANEPEARRERQGMQSSSVPKDAP